MYICGNYAGIKAGIDIDAFAPRLSFFWGIGMNFYMVSNHRVMQENTEVYKADILSLDCSPFVNSPDITCNLGMILTSTIIVWGTNVSSLFLLDHLPAIAAFSLCGATVGRAWEQG